MATYTQLIRKYPEVTLKNVGAIIHRYKMSLKFVSAGEPTTGIPKPIAEQHDLQDETADKHLDIDMGDGIVVSVPEKTLRKLLKSYLSTSE